MQAIVVRLDRQVSALWKFDRHGREVRTTSEYFGRSALVLEDLGFHDLFGGRWSKFVILIDGRIEVVEIVRPASLSSYEVFDVVGTVME
jgi:hypothetical protein